MIFFIFFFNFVIYAVGIICSKPSKYTNTTIGYRSAFAQKNADTWVEANKYCSNVCRLSAITTIIISLALWILKVRISYSFDIALIVHLLSVISLFSIIFLLNYILKAYLIKMVIEMIFNVSFISFELLIRYKKKREVALVRKLYLLYILKLKINYGQS